MRARGSRLAALVAVLSCTAHAYAQSESQPIPVPAGDEYADSDPSALTDFRGAIDPYGNWVDDPSYGTVWAPDPGQVGAAFLPYDTAGSWDYVDGDYVWVSDYEWGWVCFHYGRWAWSAGRWVWIPGREYAGAWASWRLGDDGFGYVAWAPMAPTWIWLGGFATAFGFPSQEPWAVSTVGDLLTPGVGARALTGSSAAPILAHTHPYVSAQPSIAGRSAVPHGPPPSVLGIDLTRVTLPALSTREARARQLSRPSTALPLGARPPAAHVLHASPRTTGGAYGGHRGVPSHGRR